MEASCVGRALFRAETAAVSPSNDNVRARRMAACNCVQALRAMLTANIPPHEGGGGGACWFIIARAAAQRPGIERRGEMPATLLVRSVRMTREKRRGMEERLDVTRNLEAKIVQQFETFVEISQERVSEIFFARCTQQRLGNKLIDISGVL